MAHIFFSYAHADAERFYPIHARMELVTEHNLWLDKIGLERGIAWENSIEAAIKDSYGVIFAITETFLSRPFIVNKEIPWAFERFKDRQGAQLFPILFDDVEVPELLKMPYITHLIDARDGDLERVYAELKLELPPPQAGNQPFVVSWPRLSNFKGRDQKLIDLHQKLMGKGRVGVKTAGLHGTGGIGKTQLAVEYAHRYRYYYEAGVYWLNAGADWSAELGACAVQLDRTLVGRPLEENVLAFMEYVTAQRKDALIVLDNVTDPNQVLRHELVQKLTLIDLCAQSRARLLLTTRVRTMPDGFEAISIDVILPTDARAVLLDAWISNRRKDLPDTDTLDAIADALGYLPLALGWMAAALKEMPELTPAELLRELKLRGLDALIRELRANQIDIQTPEYHDRLITTIFGWQLDQLSNEIPQQLLALTAAYGEAAVVPIERLHLLANLPEDQLVKPFPKAIRELQAYSLVETLQGGVALRLHPLTQQQVSENLNAIEQLIAATPNLVAAYRDPQVLHTRIQNKEFAQVIEDVTKTAQILTTPNANLEVLARIFLLEEPHLLRSPLRVSESYSIQQLRNRAYNEGDDDFCSACDRWMDEIEHWKQIGVRYPANQALLRIISRHSRRVQGALQLTDGRLLSWSDDATLRLWNADGSPLTMLKEHKKNVQGALQLTDGRLLSWSDDATLRLWNADGSPLNVLEGHRYAVRGALQLTDGRVLSWSDDATLRLWNADGTPLNVLEGHRYAVRGALQLTDGRLLSWSVDTTLRLWNADGSPLTMLEGHSDQINGTLQLTDGRFLSWSDDATLLLWNVDGNFLKALKGHKKNVFGALQLTDGRLLSWAGDGSLRLWNVDGSPLTMLKGHRRYINGALQLMDGRLLSWAGDTTLRLWNANGSPLTMLEGHSRRVQGALQLTDGRLLSWSDDGSLRLWNADGSPLTMLEGHSNQINGALQLIDGRLLSWSDDTTLRLWNADGNLLTMLEGHSYGVRGALQLTDDRVLSWSDDATLRLWNADGNLLTMLEGHRYRVRGVLQLTDGHLLSWAGDGSLRLWNADGNLLTMLEGHSDQINGALQLTDGRLLSWSDDTTLRLWNADGTPLNVLEGHRYAVRGALQLTDGYLLSWASDRTLRLWNADGKLLKALKGHSYGVRGALQLTDGRLLSWSDDGSLRLWNADGTPLNVLTGHRASINRALQLTDGRLLSWAGFSLGGSDPILRLWNADGNLLRMLEGHHSRINGALQLTDGRLLSWAGDGSLRLWNADGSPLMMLKGHKKNVLGALQLADGRLLSWSGDRTLRLWNADGSEATIFMGDTALCCCLELSDRRTFLMGDFQGRVLFLKLID